jgi:hypothetical protein
MKEIARNRTSTSLTENKLAIFVVITPDGAANALRVLERVRGRPGLLGFHQRGRRLLQQGKRI